MKESYEGKQSNDTRNTKNINFVPKVVRRSIKSPGLQLY